ncbi:glycosyltransferase family 2 protein [Robiginitalea sp. SC105]|uniref:glycosyltransferase family 2 protein n=1 Tax=Robiginitalea sp. SC105 TaxID=2762332 RepID=UPI00163A0867|nr:glycosyltransferase family 2 protein [Robiginitalea sp. SC105]MBC2839963.1 glycosyltransferase family 2 protein [Robiginitalea sp. SC105]
MRAIQKEQPELTALIITYNEIDHIEACIASIDFVSEIVVIDSYSTDGTYEFLRDHPRVRVIRHPFRNFTAQKNFALMHASHDWVLFIDADERIPPDLRREILETLAKPENEVSAYWFYRKFMFCGTPLRFSGWQTDKNIRLFRRSKARYSPARIVHERLEVHGATACLSASMVHYCYEGYAEYKAKMRMYGQMKALEAFGNNRRFTYLKWICKPLWRFLYNYICRLGFLDGRRGLVICYLGALEDEQRYRVLRRTEQDFRAAQFSLPRLSKRGFLVSELHPVRQ